MIILLKQLFIRELPKKNGSIAVSYFALITLISEAYSGLAQTNNLPKNRKHKIIDDFYVLITKHASQQRTAKFYAEKLHLTPQYLTTILKNETGKSISQWIDHVAIMHAKSLLR